MRRVPALLLPLVLALAVGLVAVSSALAAERRPAPKIAGTTLDGKRLSLASLRGKPVLINVWSSW